MKVLIDTSYQVKLLNNNNNAISFDEIDKYTKNNILEYDNNKFTINMITKGSDVIWIPINNNIGIKIIYRLKHNTMDNITYIKQLNLDIFPKIYKICEGMVYDTKIILLFTENILSYNIELEERFKMIKYCINIFIKYKLFPAYDWFSIENLISGKVIDFHDIQYREDLFLFKTNASSSAIDSIYNDGIKSFVNSGQKWKKHLYQGMKFWSKIDNKEYDFKGYSSDGEYYDSYIKLFLCGIESKDSRYDNVLDIGCNQGFFCFQSALLGYKKIVGIDINQKNIEIANKIQQILELNNINFIEGNAVKYVEETSEKYSLIILSSVLHQIYPNLVGSEKFLQNLAKISKYVFIELPTDHPSMNLSVINICNYLNKIFSHNTNRPKSILYNYKYKSYPPGSRICFLCYGNLKGT